MLLLAKHDRVVEIENDVGIRSSQESELERRKPEGLEKNDNIVASCLLHDLALSCQMRPSRNHDGHFETETIVVRDTILQAEPCARSAAMFDNTKGSHLKSANIAVDLAW